MRDMTFEDDNKFKYSVVVTSPDGEVVFRGEYLSTESLQEDLHKAEEVVRTYEENLLKDNAEVSEFDEDHEDPEELQEKADEARDLEEGK